MAMHPETFTFGDPFGATVAFVYFSVLAGVIGGVLFHIIRRLMRGALHAGVISVTISLGAAGLILGALYLPLLSGFYEAEVADGRLLLHYILPTRVHEVSLGHVVEVSRVPTFKGQWRCVIATASGSVYYSVHAGP